MEKSSLGYKIKKWIYQKIANWYIKSLNKIEDEKRWRLMLKSALIFNEFCVEQDIYLE